MFCKWLPLCFVLLLGACSSDIELFGYTIWGVGDYNRPSSVRVEKGDTLYSISRQHNVDLTTLSRVNNLRSPYTLHVGQKLLLSGTISGNSRSYQTVQKKTQSSASSAKKRTTAAKKKSTAKSYVYTPPKNRTAKFLWPVKGTVVSNFGVTGKGRKNDGINIKAARRL